MPSGKTSAPVLVTGGAGYIGSHACKALAAAGYRPIVYDNLSYGHEWAVRWGPLERGDVTDRARLDQVIRAHQPVAVMHFAAFAYVGESVTNPGKYYRNNTGGTLTLLEATRDHGIDKIVFSSTCATYGIVDRAVIDEDTPQAPINPYGMSKLMSERMIADFAVAHGLKWVALRYFNAAGADRSGLIGEAHDPETHLIPLALAAAAGRSPPLTIFGDDYPTRDGTCVRDFIHVEDLAAAHVRALAFLEQGGVSRAFNLGNGAGFSVNEIVASVARVTGRSVPTINGGRRAGDPATLISNSALAATVLDWRPAITRIDDIIATAWAWDQRGATATHDTAVTADA